ncbi:Hypothetical protein I595_1503 [Croceitalea dokdonensis DOKDO 023]|uniref:Uncharacterized protein n=1 Tax=Croceitalea dokdonensis DOKDO 023 TaxID=1300341 RepID=A0A0N8H4D6_9FLAO|nr:hypothetical protein [Croceitalea dokdonensis]KPM33076.1 Hypothetical protein I595_1503 [Croceitalea dokdonensis DOKDO 023]
MKTLLIALSTILAVATTQEVETITATFNGYEDGIFYFEDSEGYNLEFEQIDDKALQKFDLVSEDFNGKTFKISYTSETDLDEEGEEISISKIVDLKLIK